MNKLIAVTLSLFVTSAIAGDRHHNRHYHRHHNHHNYNWVTPMLGGVLVGVAVAKASEAAAEPREPRVTIINPRYNDPYGRVIINGRIHYTYACVTEKFDPVTGEKRSELATCIQ